MLRPGAVFDIARTWLALSGHGRRWLRGARRRRATENREELRAILNDSARRRSVLRSVRVCDRTFRDCAPAELCLRTGREPFAMYLRLVPFTCLNVEIRACMLDAFGMSYDNAGLARVALGFMVSRELNDLMERVPRAVLLRIVHQKEERVPEECLLFDQLVREGYRRLPPADFPQLYAMRNEGPLNDGEFPPQPTRDRLAGRSHLATLSGLYAARPDIPAEVYEPLRPFSFWFYALDEFADLARDREAKRPTFMATVADPEGELRSSFDAAVRALRAATPRPDRLIAMMQFLTDRAIQARRVGMDIEREFFYGGEPTRPDASGSSSTQTAR